jgi:hypothetical protein
MALGTMMKDLLLMGDNRIDHLIPGDIRFAQYMDPALRTREEAAAMYCFMLSHFVADLSMPCHCDGRRLSGYEAGPHKELEGHWSRKVGTGFGKEALTGKQIDSDQLLQQARDTDDKFDLHFDRVPSPIPGLRREHDAWLEAIYLCRASFAIASIVAPYQTYAYDDPRARAPFDAVLGEGNESTLAAVDQTAMHDAVLNTAIFWKDIWNKVSAE